MMMMTTWIRSRCLCLLERWNLMPNNRVDFEMHTKRGTGYAVRILQYWRHIHSSPRFLSGALAMVQNVELRSWSPCCRCLTFMWTQATITRWCTYDRTTRNQPNLTKANRTKPEPEPEIPEIPAIVAGKQAKSTRSSHESYDAYVYFWHLACQIQ